MNNRLSKMKALGEFLNVCYRLNAHEIAGTFQDCPQVFAVNRQFEINCKIKGSQKQVIQNFCDYLVSQGVDAKTSMSGILETGFFIRSTNDNFWGGSIWRIYMSFFPNGKITLEYVED